MKAQGPAGAHDGCLATIDVLLESLVRDAGRCDLEPLGDWLSAYRRVTHYFRALNVWSPPPHLLAWTVLGRAARRAAGDRGGLPLRLAMEEAHAMLREGRGPTPDAEPLLNWEGSVRWRVGSWLVGRGSLTIPGDIAPGMGLAWHRAIPGPVPAMAPSPMVPQPLAGITVRRVLTALNRIRQLAFSGRWRRRHA